MTTDRELLEGAARAAGIEIDWDGDRALVVQMFRGHLKNWLDWNPLTDDGDALRLAVNLELELWFGCGGLNAGGMTLDVEEEYGVDPFAATRRAIVRAAYEIGREKV